MQSSIAKHSHQSEKEPVLSQPTEKTAAPEDLVLSVLKPSSHLYWRVEGNFTTSPGAPRTNLPCSTLRGRPHSSGKQPFVGGRSEKRRFAMHSILKPLWP